MIFKEDMNTGRDRVGAKSEAYEGGTDSVITS